MNEEVILKYANSLNWSEGVTKHQQTYKAFLRAAGLGVKPSHAVEIVLDKVLEANGQLDRVGVLRQCRRAYEYVTGKTSAKLPDNVLPREDGSYAKSESREFSFDRLKEMTASFEGEISRQWFLDRSPKRPRTAHEFLCEIFPSGERVAVLTGMKQRKPGLIWSHELADFGQLASDEGVFFLPNPITGNRHLVSRLKSETNPEGESWRCEEAVTAWRYMLLESDLDENEYPGVGVGWLRFLALLQAPIVSIVGSGGKSIHALVKVDAVSKAGWDGTVRPFKEPLRELGADPGALSAVRLTRLPHSFRNGNTQDLYYCNSNATSTPIAEEGGWLK